MATTPAPYTQELRASFDRMLYVLAQLEPEELENARLDNGWTPAVLVAHVAFWDDAQRRRMEAAVRGEPYVRPAGDNDGRAAAESRPFTQLLAEAEVARAALIAFAQSLSAEALASEYPEGERTLSLDKLLAHMINHVRSHTAELFAYAASLRRWGRAGLRNLLDVQHSILLDSVAGLDETTIQTTQVAGGWTLRDQLVHILAWSEYGHHVVAAWPEVSASAIAEWEAAPGEDEDEANARLLSNRAAMTMIDVLDMLATWHRRTLLRIDKMDDALLASHGDFGTPWGGEGELCHFLYSMCLHQAEHAVEIWETRT